MKTQWPSSRESRLLFFNEIPAWQQDNEHILSGYRATSGSIRRSLASLLYLHNQTVNAYSHLIGAAAFLALPLYFYRYEFSHQSGSHVEDVYVMSIYSFGVAVCFTLSAIFHIMCNHSPSFASLGNKLDYIGILILMWAASIPTIYYGFLCSPALRIVYWILMTGMAICCAIFTLSPPFASPQFRHWRACFYAGFGLSSMIFIVHAVVIYGWELQKLRMSLSWMSWMAEVNLVGAAVYAARVPERWSPYRFDIWGASHQIFHVAVVMAACIHYDGLVEAFHWIRSQDHPCGDI
ncbi:putative hemolysin-III channel protein Izh2 [Xylariaceae sp. FL0255]|nr:putative hemolysin-III channel protein Izh2 [Xylariaceae sp. FL0255]